MIPLNIAIGPKAIPFIIDNRENRAKLEQHCLIYSDKMLEKYMEIDIDAAEALMEYIDAHEGEVGFSKSIKDSPSLGEPLEQTLARMCPREERYFPSNIVILFEDEKGREVRALGSKKANIITTKEIKNNRKNIFNMLSPDTGSLDVEPGEDCRFWAEYFSRIIEGEETVLFMSRYGLTNDSIQSLKEYYLPNIPLDIKKIMYASDTFISLSRDEAKRKIEDDVILQKSSFELYLIEEPQKYHERWIQTENYYIYQGKGFSMLNSSRTRKISTSSTVIVEKRQRELPKAERVI